MAGYDLPSFPISERLKGVASKGRHATSRLHRRVDLVYLLCSLLNDVTLMSTKIGENMNILMTTCLKPDTKPTTLRKDQKKGSFTQLLCSLGWFWVSWRCH